jgi:hypothetical protein
VVLGIVLAWCGLVQARDVRETYDLLKSGSSLTAKEAEELEERVQKKPKDEEARIRLLSYYAIVPKDQNVAAIKEARARHILWLIENDPKDGLGLFAVATGVYRVNCEGDELADPGAFRSMSELWLQQVRKNPESAEIRREAAAALQYCAPEEAERLLTEGKDQAGLGRLYARAVLGITGLSYASSEPLGSSAEYRMRPFAEKARTVLEQATDGDFLAAATGALLREGAMLCADGKLDWDYTKIGNDLLARAKAAAPRAMTLLTLPTALPALGQRPPATIRVGGNVQQKKLVRQPRPAYPMAARAQGITGRVEMTALLGLDGKVLGLLVEAGPPELIEAAVESVRQWEYEPTLLNGKPCYVMTRIDDNYTMTR